ASVAPRAAASPAGRAIPWRLAAVSALGANCATATAYGASSAFMSSACAGGQMSGMRVIIVRHSPPPESTRCRMTPSPRPTSPSGVARVLALVAGLALVAVTLTACGADPARPGPANRPTASDTPSAPPDDDE